MRKLYICDYSTYSGHYYWDMRCYRHQEDAEKRADRLEKRPSVRFVRINEVLPCWEPDDSYEREFRSRMKAQLENYRLRKQLRALLDEVLEGATKGFSRKRCREVYDRGIEMLAASCIDLSKAICHGDQA